MESTELVMYALIDASAKPEILSTIKKLISVYGCRIRDGYIVTPNGCNQIIFFETRKKECPIVEVLDYLSN